MVTSDPSIFSILWGWTAPHLTSLLTSGTIIGCTKYLSKVLKPLLSWAKVHLDEHDLMWEEYCKRNGISWRISRPIGRGLSGEKD